MNTTLKYKNTIPTARSMNFGFLVKKTEFNDWMQMEMICYIVADHSALPHKIVGVEVSPLKFLFTIKFHQDVITKLSCMQIMTQGNLNWSLPQLSLFYPYNF